MKPIIVSIYDKTEIATGAHKRQIGLLKELKDRGYTIYLFSPVNFLDQEKNYFKIPPNQDKILPKAVQTLLSVRNKMKEFKNKLSNADVILVFGFSHALASLYPKKQLKIPLIFAVRSNVYEYRKISFEKRDNSKLKPFINKFKKYFYLRIFSRVERYVYSKSDKMVVQNKVDFRNLTDNYGVNIQDINIIRNNINFLKPETAPYSNKSSRLESIIFVGTLSQRKGIMLLIEAVKDLVKKNVLIKLDILGDGELKNDIQSYIIHHDIEDKIVIHGFVKDPLRYIANSDLLVMPSISDSFPNSVLESLYVETPAIGSNVGGISEILEYQSLLFEPGSVDTIKDKIESLLTPTAYQEIQAQCKKRKEKFIFDWTGKFEKLISNATANK